MTMSVKRTSRPTPLNGPLTATSGLQLDVRNADILEVEADCLVVLVNTNLDLSKGQLSNKVLAKAGNKLQADLRRKYPKGIKVGQVIEIDVQNMRCKQILMSELTYWSNIKSTRELKQLMNDLLKKADGLGYSSVVFPALGTGIPEYPSKEVAATMCQVTLDFPAEHLETVVFAIYDNAVVLKNFQQERIRQLRKLIEKEPYITCGEETIIYFTTDDKFLAVHVSMGAVSGANVDAIVSTEDMDGLGRSSVATDILNKAGRTYREIEHPKVKKAGLKLTEVFDTNAGELHCSKVLHAVVPTWSTTQPDQEDTFVNNLKTTSRNILQKASDLKLTSVAIPYLGSCLVEEDRSAIDTCCKPVINELVQFVLQEKTTLTDLHIVTKNGTAHNEYVHELLIKCFKTN